jgi:hypothetical protein
MSVIGYRRNVKCFNEVYFKKNMDEERVLPPLSINHQKFLFLCLQGDSGGPLHVANGTEYSVVGKLIFHKVREANSFYIYQH